MSEDWTVPELVEDLKAGRIERRSFISKMVAAGITIPAIAAMLQACGASNKEGGGGTASRATFSTATAPASAEFQPTKRGGGGTLKLL